VGVISAIAPKTVKEKGTLRKCREKNDWEKEKCHENSAPTFQILTTPLDMIHWNDLDTDWNKFCSFVLFIVGFHTIETYKNM